jgi:competence protein ComEA
MTDDASDVKARLADSAAAAAAKAYEAAYGSPIASEARGVRWRLDLRVAVTVLVVVLGLAALAWYTVSTPTVPVVAPVTASPAPHPQPSVVVHVAGQVKHPGLVSLDPSSRVADALAAAGGPTSHADTSAINLARHVQDGEQIYVPRRGGSAHQPVNVNRASATELETLPGIGPALAARIVADRRAHGSYARLSDLTRVSGIGAALVAGLEGVATS